ncbi:MAG: CopG family transcriptional regulator [Caldilineaceae bacterium]
MTQVLLSDQIAEKLKQLADERGATLMELIEQIVEDYLARAEYDEALDPAIALFSGPVDLASNAKAILRSEIKPQSGWTQKEIAK